MLVAWRYLASDEPIVSQEQLSKISNYALSPLSRIVLALYDENPAAYQPLCSLFIVYFWLELFGKKSKLTAKVKMSKKQKEHKMRGLYKDSFVILQLINSPSLKFKLAIALKTADIFLQKFANNKQQNLSFIDKIRIFLYAFWWVVSIKKQTVFKKN